jgi:hypothetical protein
LGVRDVVCAVIPHGKGDPAPLLGQRFLRYFDGRLDLTGVEPDKAAVLPGLDPPGRARLPASG